MGSVADGTAPSVRKHFAEIKDLRFGPSTLDVTAEPHALRIRATGYAYMVRIEQPEVGMRLSVKVLAFPLPQPTD
ncbi:hypothetical protein [Streptomyces sp. CS147]|uniref:hypothetical protein n=1 Tax=Streptomyces sp. CS147 TaxID=2162715 RepID=UPI000D50EBC6|nr:hypothetical protein [Streptomyces sp. CS147]PVC93134.1 hypothetical protein DBP21_34450 [Streptomyces sp. CS147]